MTDLATILTALTSARMIARGLEGLNVIAQEVEELLPVAKKILALCGEEKKAATPMSKLGELHLSKRARTTLALLLVGRGNDSSVQAMEEMTIEQAAQVIDLADLVHMRNVGAVTIKEIQRAFSVCGKELRWTAIPATQPALESGPGVLPVEDLRTATFREEGGNNG